MLKKILAIILSVILANNSFANCENKLNRCDAALQESLKLNSLQKDLIIIQEDRINLLQKDVDLKSQELQAWYRDPIVIGLLGLTAGFALGVYVLKK